VTTPAPPYTPTEEDPLRSVEYVSAVLEFPADTIREWLRTERLKGRKVGGQWRVPQSELTRFVNQEHGDPS
jgi:excisionase family DNA binding protein